MEELFRFLVARPAQRADAAGGTVPLRPSGRFRNALRDAAVAANPRTAFQVAARAQRQSDHAIHSIEDLRGSAALQRFGEAIDGVDEATLNEIRQIIRESFGVNADEVARADAFNSNNNALSDALIANAILGQRSADLDSNDAVRFLRLLDIIRRVAAGDAAIAAPNGVREARQRTLLYPSDLFPLTRAAAAPPKDDDQPPDDVVARIAARRDDVFATYTAITRIQPEHVATEQRIGGAIGAEVGGAMAHPPLLPLPAPDAGALEPFRARTVKGGKAQAGVPFMLRAEAAGQFDPRVRRVFAERGIDAARMSLNSIVTRLSEELLDLDTFLAAHRGAAAGIVPFGGGFFSKLTLAGGSIRPPLGNIGDLFGNPDVPTTHGHVTPVGIGDLLVVRQFLKRYEGRELAHIENILRGELKERTHRRARTTEETVTVETELTKEEERDQQTTERFELKTEASEIQKQDESLKAGLTISGSYGPMLQFTATTEFALNHSREESSRVATSYSKDVTSRASSKVFERRREERILKTIEVFEETNKHTLNNVAGAASIVGQYQWVDKIYEAQVFNYGKRMLFDLMLPEPAAFLLYAAAAQPQPGADLIKPQPFNIAPTDITEWNYAYFAQIYQAVGIDAPPEPLKTIGKVLDGQGAAPTFEALKSAEVPVPDDYEAISGNLIFTATETGGGGVSDVVVGKAYRQFGGTAGTWSFSMNNETGSIPVTFNSLNVSIFSLALEILCTRTQRGLDQWKLKTYAAILQAYEKQLRDYEEALAARKVEAADKIQGHNPIENERLIRNELKKGAISVFTAQHYDLFGAIGTSSQGFPQPILGTAEAEGRYIRFFEQCFEWEQMMFFFYPYFWGRKDNWPNRALLEDVDPLFADFIRAGAARLVIPVRLGFEQALAHFLDTGQVWDGGDLPPITSPLYLSIIEEIRERDRAPGTEVPQDEPWDVRLPTTLIRLRDGAALPEWRKNAAGEWVPV